VGAQSRGIPSCFGTVKLARKTWEEERTEFCSPRVWINVREITGAETAYQSKEGEATAVKAYEDIYL